MNQSRFGLAKALGAYLLLMGGIGILGLLIAVFTDLKSLSVADLSLSTFVFALPAIAGWRLWRQGWSAWPWVVAAQLPQIADIATGQRLFRAVIGFFWELGIRGDPPQAGFGFAISVADPRTQPDLGQWLGLNLIPLGLALLAILYSRYARRHELA